ncbi:SMP-30/gluconolactonase/LRE family protein [Falsiroseomonas selenitidurans]|uniref:SMP-30/Gluconolactonase/LRE-like region domain-containing protein n=1 Tax=Falsiroseomonas selenitidurans TaxID=2716335 RepID=A0ABX1ECC1_9PROT|nr:SMP-30/gluconolactonase/LRE family protein [Falsiroseomonas selenitidurans]NKC34608.1 hypothetical protein [Falsiroseomonas selenitidurans]
MPMLPRGPGIDFVIVWLASFPRSGNTLLRRRLREIFGLSTRSVYDDPSDIGATPERAALTGHLRHGESSAAFVARARASEETSLVKTHELPDPADDSPVIYVVRDGRSAVVSYWYYLAQVLPRARKDRLLQEVMAGLVRFGSWSAHVEAWLAHPAPRQVVRYEALAAREPETLVRIAALLGRPAPDDFAALHAAYPEFFRRGDDAANIGELEAICPGLFDLLHGETQNRPGYPPARVVGREARRQELETLFGGTLLRGAVAASDRRRPDLVLTGDGPVASASIEVLSGFARPSLLLDAAVAPSNARWLEAAEARLRCLPDRPGPHRIRLRGRSLDHALRLVVTAGDTVLLDRALPTGTTERDLLIVFDAALPAEGAELYLGLPPPGPRSGAGLLLPARLGGRAMLSAAPGCRGRLGPATVRAGPAVPIRLAGPASERCTGQEVGVRHDASLFGSGGNRGVRRPAVARPRRRAPGPRAVTPRAVILRAAGARLGEGPVWDAARGVLWWLDIQGQRLHRTDPTDPERDAGWPLPVAPGCLAICEDGTLLVAMQDGLARFDPARGALSPRLPFETDRPGNRSNDGKAGPDGAFWVGTMPAVWPAPPTGALWRLSPGRPPQRVLDGIGCPNALCWSPDRHTLYFADSLARRVMAHPFDVATGHVGAGRVLLDLAESPAGLPAGAAPDGATVDAAGRIWVAIWDGGCVLALTPAGEVACRLDLPARRPTCPAFGGPGLRTLFVTSARLGLPVPTEADGALLAIADTGAEGMPEPRLAWPAALPPRLADAAGAGWR